MKNLSEKAILVSLVISSWSARKIDKKVTREVEESHDAKDAGRYNKKLLDKKDLEELEKIAREAREFHNKNTLPWSDSGDRLLPATNYFNYINNQRVFKQQFENAIETFIKRYPDLKDNARLRLNEMYDEKDYPSVAKLRKKFSITSSFMPIAKLDDFRITVNQVEVDKLKEEIEQNVYKRINDATKDLWLRIKEAVKHMYEKLADKDAIFRDSLVTNVTDLIELLPRLNFTNDAEINMTIEQMKKLSVSADYLRKDNGKRSETAANAKEILSKINDFIGADFDEESSLSAAA